MKKVVLASILMLMAVPVAFAHHGPQVVQVGPSFGFQIGVFAPPVGVSLYVGDPIFIGPGYADGWGCHTIHHHRYYGWYREGYFHNCEYGHRWEREHNHGRGHAYGWDRDEHDRSWHRDRDRDRDRDWGWDRDHDRGWDDDSHHGGRCHH